MTEAIERPWQARWSQWQERHGRRASRFAIAILLALVAFEVHGAYARPVDVSLSVGARHANVIEARIELAQRGEIVRSLTRRFAHGAPADVRETFDLAPGTYDVSIRFTERDGRTSARTSRLSAPADGVVHLRLGDSG